MVKSRVDCSLALGLFSFFLSAAIINLFYFLLYISQMILPFTDVMLYFCTLIKLSHHLLGNSLYHCCTCVCVCHSTSPHLHLRISCECNATNIVIFLWTIKPLFSLWLNGFEHRHSLDIKCHWEDFFLRSYFPGTSQWVLHKAFPFKAQHLKNVG